MLPIHRPVVTPFGLGEIRLWSTSAGFAGICGHADPWCLRSTECGTHWRCRPPTRCRVNGPPMNSTRPRSRWAAFAGVGIIGFASPSGGRRAAHSRQRARSARFDFVIAVEITLLHNFAWHERWTWRERAGGGPARVLVRLARVHAGTGVASLVVTSPLS